MSKYYYIEIKEGDKWKLLQTETRLSIALEYVRLKHKDGRVGGPLRIVRTTRHTIYTEEKK
jgi:hypothetical protein